MSPLQRLRLPNELVAFMSHLPPTIKVKLRYALDDLLSDPHLGKPLRAELIGWWSLRVGRFRIIYRTRESVLEIIAIGPRSTIYSELSERLKKIKSPHGH